MKKIWASFLVLMGAKAEAIEDFKPVEQTAEGVTFKNEDLTKAAQGIDALNAKISNLTTDLEAANASLVEKTTELQTATEKVTALTADVAAKDTEISGLKARLAGKTEIKQEAPTNEKNEENNSGFADAPWNKEAEAMLGVKFND